MAGQLQAATAVLASCTQAAADHCSHCPQAALEALA